MYKRAEKVAEAVHEEISGLLLKGVKDPRVSLVTVTGVKVTDDLHLATVYYTLLGGGDETTRKGVQAGLESARGYLRREVGKALRMRYIPDLIFRYDDSLDYGVRIDSLLKEIASEGGHD
jgi:ribosome-binding factor A